jgi:hypothetical protein
MSQLTAIITARAMKDFMAAASAFIAKGQPESSRLPPGLGAARQWLGLDARSRIVTVSRSDQNRLV